METKCIEIRDSATRILVFGLPMNPADLTEHKYMHSEGYPLDGSAVILFVCSNQKATVDPDGWGALGYGDRTMQTAHSWIIENWSEIETGEVVDVRVILGEATESARSDMLEPDIEDSQ